jgi:hypothetical protein
MVQAVAPAMGLPPMNIAAMLASMLGGSLAMGWIIHLMMGTIVWPAAYGYLVQARLPGTPWLRGGLFGLLLGIFVLIIGFPLVGAMFPSLAPQPGFLALGLGGALATLGVVAGHLIYGVVLGAVAGPPSEPRTAPTG